MSKFKDLTGLKFGRLTVVERDGKDNRGNIKWSCICDCGKHCTKRGSALSSGHTKSCGCFGDESRKTKDLTGQKFGRLTVLARSRNTTWGTPAWLCVCDCGQYSIPSGEALRNSGTKSCGCLQREWAKANIKHGLLIDTKSHPLYTLWLNMKRRCAKNASAENKKWYVDRGISVCTEWKNSSTIFFKWCLENGWKEDLEIDRRNNDKGYCPENCRFVTPLVNTHNQRLIQANNTTGFRGVYKHIDKYKSELICFGKKYRLGIFSDPVSAAIARDMLVISLGAIEMPLNFPGLKGDCK